MAAKEYWKIDNQKEQEVHKIEGLGELEKFSFEVKRLKDVYVGLEVLRITAFYNGEEYGTIVSKIAQLDTNITNLSDIGINLSRVEFVELSTLMKNNYYSLIPQVGEGIENNVSDKLVEGVVQYFRDYIVDKAIEQMDGFYNVPTDAFKSEFNESVFKHYNISDVKEALKIRHITRCNAKRNDFAIKKDGQNKRYISFDSNVIDKVE